MLQLITSSLFCWQEQLNVSQTQINRSSENFRFLIARYEGFDDMLEGPSGEEILRRELQMTQKTDALLSGLSELGIGLLVGGYVATNIYNLNIDFLSLLSIGFAATCIRSGYKKTKKETAFWLRGGQ